MHLRRKLLLHAMLAMEARMVLIANDPIEHLAIQPEYSVRKLLLDKWVPLCKHLCFPDCVVRHVPSMMPLSERFC